MNAIRNANQLIELIENDDRVVVAFSGGVDSSVVAAAAKRSKVDAIAVTARSPSVAKWQQDWAVKVAGEIQIEHQFVETDEAALPEYQRNDSQRCFYCKQTLYQSLAAIAACQGNKAESRVILSGTNADDLGDHRPGIQAGTLAGVKTPLAELGFGKKEVRELAVHFGLSNHDLPASPCLASRVAYGVEVTPERLGQIELAEDWLRAQQFSDCRVRLHADSLVRVEVPPAEVARLMDQGLAAEMTRRFQSIGFRYVTLDLQGLRSGSLNDALVAIGTNQDDVLESRF